LIKRAAMIVLKNCIFLFYLKCKIFFYCIDTSLLPVLLLKDTGEGGAVFQRETMGQATGIQTLSATGGRPGSRG